MKAFTAFLLPAALAAQTINPFPIPLRLDFGESPRFKIVGLGVLASRPATCTQGNVYICVGAGCTGSQSIHYCTATNTWTVQGGGTGTGDLLAVNNLSDVSNIVTARNNLGITSGSGAPASTACDSAGEVGREYINTDETAAERKKYFCIATDTATYEWLAFQQDVGLNSKQGSGTEVPGSTSGYVTALADGDMLAYQTTGTRWANRQLAGTANEITMTVSSGQPVFSIAAAFDISGKTSTKPVKTGTVAPGTCGVGELFFDTDATAGQNIFGCTALNTWTLEGDGGAGGGAPSDATYITKTANSTLSAEFALGTLSTGFLQVATTTGDLASRTIAAGAGISVANGDGSGGNPTVSVDTATIASLDTIQRNTALYLADAGASDAYSASPTPTPTGSIATGSIWTLKPNTANTGASTVDVDAGGALAAVAIKYANGSTDTATGDILAGDFLQLLYDGTAMRLPPVIVNSGNVRGKLPLANLTAPSAGQYIYSSDGVTASSRQPLFSDLSGNASANQLGSSVNAQTGTTYTILNGDRGKLVTHTNAGAIAVTLPQAGSGGNFANDWFYCTQNRGAGTVTITPTTSTIDGAASLALTTNQGACIWSDATNYFTMRGIGGAGSPGGSDTQIQYNNAGAFGGSANLTWDNTNADVGVGGTAVGSLYLKNSSNQVEVGMSYGCDAGNTTCLAQNYKLAWSSNANGVGAEDVGIARGAAGVLNIHDGSATITNYRDLKLRELVVTTGTEGTCNSTNRGRIVFVAGGAGVADTYRICRKDGGDAYAFVALF